MRMKIDAAEALATNVEEIEKDEWLQRRTERVRWAHEPGDRPVGPAARAPDYPAMMSSGRGGQPDAVT